MRHGPTLALLLGAACQAAPTHSQSAPEGGYEVTRSQTVLPVPHGKVGRKTVDRETRTGNTEETDGNSSNFTLTVGGFMDRCPTSEGSEPVKFVVPGDFEYSVVVDSVDTDIVPTERKHYEKRMTARIKVFVNDDLSVTEGEIDGQFTSHIDGVRTGPVPLRKRFAIRAYGMPDWDALREAVTVTGDMAAAALMWNASSTILESQSKWIQPNACAELLFDPPSETVTMGPGETREVRVTYRTRDSKQLIPRGKWDATAFGSGSRVAENRGDVGEDGTFVVHYTAGSNPKDGDGVRPEAISPGGYAQEMWKIRVGGDYELHFESTIVSRDPAQAVRSRATGTVNLKGSSKPWRLQPDGKLYRLHDGKGAVSFQTTPLPNRDPCDPLISGSGTSELTVVDTYIKISPPHEQNGVQVAGSADVQMAYEISMGAGETANEPYVLNFNCVILPERAMPFPFWWSSFLSGREAEGDVNFLRNWDYVGRDSVVARKALRGNCGGLCDEELSVFTLKQVKLATGK